MVPDVPTIQFAGNFAQVVVLLLIATIAGVLFLRLKQPPIIGFIVVGILVGPSGLKLVASAEQVELFAQMGLALLLFIVGLKLDPRQLRTMGKASITIGVCQIVITTIGGFLLASVIGMDTVNSLYVAVAMTLSSTIIIVKLLSDKKETESLYGRITLGLLIIQDVAVVFLMVLLIAFSGENSQHPAYQGFLIIMKGVILGATAWIMGAYVLPKLFSVIARSTELLILSGIGWALAMAAAGDLLGFSKEIGAFIAGISLASTPFREALGAKLSSLRDFLLLFFFIELGSRLNLSVVGEAIWGAVPLSLYVLIGNPLIMAAITGVMGYRKRTSFMSGISIAQVSEFSMILMALGVGLGHVKEAVAGVVTLTAMITIWLSTYMILYSQRLYEVLAPYLNVFERKKSNREDSPGQIASGLEAPDIMIFGMGNYGMGIAEQFESRGRKVIGIDFDPEAVRRWRAKGMYALFGDARDAELANALHLGTIRWVISSIRNGETNRYLLAGLRNGGYAGLFAESSSQPRSTSKAHEDGPDMVFNPFQDAAIQAVDLVFAKEDQIARKAMDKHIDTMSQHYLICGYGRMGQQIVRDLSDYNVPCVVVEWNPEQLPKLRENNIPHIEGRASEDKSLLKAGILRAKGLIAVAASDEENVFIVLTARVLNPHLFIVARSILQANEDKLRHAGADRVMSPYVLGGRKMAASVIKPEVMDFLDVVLHDDRNDTEMATVTALAGTDCIGKTLRELNPWETCGVTLLAVRRRGEDLHPNPSPDFVLREDDDLIVMGTVAQIEAARNQLSHRKH